MYLCVCVKTHTTAQITIQFGDVSVTFVYEKVNRLPSQYFYSHAPSPLSLPPLHLLLVYLHCHIYFLPLPCFNGKSPTLAEIKWQSALAKKLNETSRACNFNLNCKCNCNCNNDCDLGSNNNNRKKRKSRFSSQKSLCWIRVWAARPQTACEFNFPLECFVHSRKRNRKRQGVCVAEWGGERKKRGR